MKKALETSAIAFAAVLAMAAPISSAYAACGVCPSCDPRGEDQKQSNRVIEKINSRLDAMQNDIVKALKDQASQNSSSLNQQSASITAGLDGLSTNLQNMEIQRQTAATIKEHMPSATGCGNTSQASALLQASIGSKAEAQNIFHQLNNATSSTGWHGGKVPPSSPDAPIGSADDVAARFDTLQLFREINPSDKANEDINPIGTLFDKTTIDNTTLVDRGGASVPAGATEQKAYQQMVRNLVNEKKQDPVPLSLTDPVKASFAGKEAYTKQRGHEGKKEMAAAPFIKIGSMRAPTADFDESMDSFFKNGKDSEAVYTLPIDAQKEIRNGKVSEYFLLNEVMNQKYQSPKWHANLWKDTSDNVQRQMAQMMAFSLMLQWRQYQLLEVIAGTLGTQLGLNLDSASKAGFQAEALPVH